MIKLKKDFKVGDTFEIPANLEYAWQSPHHAPIGKYVITEISGDEDGWGRKVSCVSESSCKVLMDYESLCYLLGTKVENPPYLTIINGEEYLPELTDDYKCNYFTRDEEGITPWYFDFYHFDDSGFLNIGNNMFYDEWCYCVMPWDEHLYKND